MNKRQDDRLASDLNCREVVWYHAIVVRDFHTQSRNYPLTIILVLPVPYSRNFCGEEKFRSTLQQPDGNDSFLGTIDNTPAVILRTRALMIPPTLYREVLELV